MTNTRRRFALSLVCLTGVCWLAGLSTVAAGIWDKQTRSRQSASQQRVPTPAELGVFFIDAAAPTPPSFETLGNEVAIDNAAVAPVSSNENDSVSPVSEEPADVDPPIAGDEPCGSGCDGSGHSWWCRTKDFWGCQSLLSRQRRAKNSRSLNQQSYYTNVPAYRVENYGFYRTCWHRLQESDCCPEDEVHQEKDLIPEPEPIKE